MYKIQFEQVLVLLLVVVLCNLIGCAKQHQGVAGGILFEVDGERYWLDRHADVDKAGKVASSSLLVRPYSEIGAGYWETEYASARGTTITTIILDDRRITAQTDTLYFVRNGKIAFEKKYQDLGIDSSQLSAENEAVLAYLQPTLEKMIRENLVKDETNNEQEQEDEKRRIPMEITEEHDDQMSSVKGLFAVGGEDFAFWGEKANLSEEEHLSFMVFYRTTPKSNDKFGLGVVCQTDQTFTCAVYWEEEARYDKVAPFAIYFLDGCKIVFSKTFTEVGLTDSVFVPNGNRDQLYGIFEKLILDADI